jgi:transcriptional regulator with XRE-family HTH domain
VALQQRQRNWQLRQQRRLRGWSLNRLALELHALAIRLGEPEPGVDSNTVSRWERGVIRPSPYYTRLLCLLCNLPAAELGLVEEPEPPASYTSLDRLLSGWGLDEMQRREFLRVMAAVVGGSALAPLSTSLPAEAWERLAKTLQRPGRIDDATLADLEQVTIALEQLERDVRPRSLLGPTLGHLETLTHLLRENPPTEAQRQIASMLGETAGVAGWLLWDLGANDQASAYVRTALEAAREADDAPLGAYLIGTASVVENRRENPDGRVARLMERHFGFSRSDASPTTQAYLAMLEAKARARSGKGDRSLRAIEEATVSMVSRDDPEWHRPRVTFYDSVRLAGEQGLCLARLKRSADARGVLEPALAALAPDQVKTRPGLMAALAVTYLHDGEFEEACRVGGQALSMAAELEIEPSRQDVMELREQLTPWDRTPAVRELDEQLAMTNW